MQNFSEKYIIITAITILIRKGITDAVTFYTNLPNTFCGMEDECLALSCELPKNSGINYVKKYFPNIKPKIIDIKDIL